MSEKSDMELLTTRDLILTCRDRYRKQRSSLAKHNHPAIGNVQNGVLDNLDKLDLAVATVDDVVAAGLNQSWCKPYCDRCGEFVDLTVTMDVTGGEHGTGVCEKCLRQAISLVDAHNSNNRKAQC